MKTVPHSKYSQHIRRRKQKYSDVAPRRNPLEYAEALELQLPSGSSESGDYDRKRTPYFERVAEAVDDPHYNRVCYTCATQMSKTFFSFVCLAKVLDESPVPCLYVSPEKSLSKTVSNKFQKFVESNPHLFEKQEQGHRNKIEEKFFSGIRLGFGWASNVVQLCSNEAGLVICDERDRMLNDVGNEGSPDGLLFARTATYSDSTLVVMGSPTVEGNSPIVDLFYQGTKERWFVPCPKCNGFFFPEMKLLRWIFLERESCCEDVYLECPHCNFKIVDEYRDSLNQDGIYVSENQKVIKGKVKGELPRTRTASFWISGLCSPWRTYEESADSFALANHKKNFADMKTSVNTIFGETWKVKGKKPSEAQIERLVGDLVYGEIPDETTVLTCGVDVGQDRLHYSVRAWTYRGESFTVDHGEIFSPRGCEDSQVWGDLKRLVLEKRYKIPNDGGFIRVWLCAVDSGFLPHTVYFFCQTTDCCLPIKGQKATFKSIVSTSKQQVRFKGGHIPGGIKLFNIRESYFKDLLHSRIRRGKIKGDEAWHLPKGIDREFLKQILGEEYLEHSTGIKEWIKVYDNHYLDAEKQNEFCGYLLNVNSFKKDENAWISQSLNTSRNRILYSR